MSSNVLFWPTNQQSKSKSKENWPVPKSIFGGFKASVRLVRLDLVSTKWQRQGHEGKQSRNSPSQGLSWILCAWVLRMIKHHRGAQCLAFYQSFASLSVKLMQHLIPLFKRQKQMHLNTDLDVNYHGNCRSFRALGSALQETIALEKMEPGNFNI